MSVALLVCMLAATNARATTDSFGPKLPVALSYDVGISGHNNPAEEEHWHSFGAFEQEGRSLSAPISGTLSEVRLEYGTVTGTDIQIWTAEAATGTLERLAGAVHLGATGETTCGEREAVETLKPDIPISASEVLVLLNSDESGGVLCAYPDAFGHTGFLGDFGESFTPEPQAKPFTWTEPIDLGIALEGTVTTEPTSPTGGNEPTASTGGSTNTNNNNNTSVICNMTTSCEVSIGSVTYKITIDPGGKLVYTKQASFYELEPRCEVHGVFVCEGTTYNYCICSPFGQVSRVQAPKPTLAGKASFKIKAGKTGKVKVSLSRAAQTALKRRHTLHLTTRTILKLPAGKTSTSSGSLTVALRRR